MCIHIDDNSIAINAYIHDNNHNACGLWLLPCIHIHDNNHNRMPLWVLLCIYTLHSNIMDININE